MVVCQWSEVKSKRIAGTEAGLVGRHWESLNWERWDERGGACKIHAGLSAVCCCSQVVHSATARVLSACKDRRNYNVI